MRFDCRFAVVVALASSMTLTARPNPGNGTAAANVNSRYTVERVEVTPLGLERLSPPLRDRLQQLVGVRFDTSLLEDAAARLRRELRNREVTTQVTRGSTPDRVAVTFHIEMEKREFDANLTELLYHSKEQFGFGLDFSYRAGANRVHGGALTGNDERVERASGLQGGYEFMRGRFSVGFDAGTWRSQWSGSTLTALADNPDLGAAYRERQTFQPAATIRIFKPLTLQLGVSVERLEVNTPAARHELSSAALGTLRFQRRWGLDSRTGFRQRLEAAYGIRAGSPSLSSDYSFVRHHAMARYGARRDRHEMIASVQAGLLNGRAPLGERFIGGNSRILRGWNRFDLTPVGASRLAHASFDYRWRCLRLSYDAGSVRSIAPNGEQSGSAGLRQSAGIGFSSNLWSGFSFLVAFPLREGRAEPIFIAGMNF